MLNRRSRVVFKALFPAESPREVGNPTSKQSSMLDPTSIIKISLDYHPATRVLRENIEELYSSVLSREQGTIAKP